MIEIQEFLCEILQLWDRGLLTACADNSRSVDGFLQTFLREWNVSHATNCSVAVLIWSMIRMQEFFNGICTTMG